MKKLRVYIDESGSPHTRKPIEEEKYFVLSGVLIDEKLYPEIREKINQLKISSFGTDQIILHWSDIDRERGDFCCLRNREIRKKFFKELERTYRNLNLCHISALVNQWELYEKYAQMAWHPYHYGLRIIMERAYMHAKDEGFGNVELIAEGVNPTADQHLREEHMRLLKLGSQHVSNKHFTELGYSLSIHVKKKNINGLQIADLTASIMRRTWIMREKGERYPFAYKYVRTKIRKSRSGKTKGFGVIKVP